MLHAHRDTLFEGRDTDVSPSHLGPLAHAVRQSGAALGFATDVDAGRFALLDGQGRYVSPNHFLGLLYDYLMETRGWRLGVARTVATSRLVDAAARRHGPPGNAADLARHARQWRPWRGYAAHLLWHPHAATR